MLKFKSLNKRQRGEISKHYSIEQLNNFRVKVKTPELGVSTCFSDVLRECILMNVGSIDSPVGSRSKKWYMLGIDEDAHKAYELESVLPIESKEVMLELLKQRYAHEAKAYVTGFNDGLEKKTSEFRRVLGL
ncbi:hypothetical protein AB4254_11595 [Vibrio breoganii]